MGLGLILMLGGDGDVARRAGDALIADKVKDAIEEGGFDSVDYQAWDKGFDGGRFWVGFSKVKVVRGSASLGANVAVIYPMSVELRFEQGDVALAAEDAHWRFDSVRIDGSYSLFGRGLAIQGVNLRLDDSSSNAIPDCLFMDACGAPVHFDGALERFALHLGRSGGRTDLEFSWRDRGECVRIAVSDVRVDRSQSLAEIGRDLLSDEYDGPVELDRGHCAAEQQGTDSEGISIAPDSLSQYRSSWSRRDHQLDDVLAVLMVSVPEAYQYLVE